ncbi:hypothetical protein PspLS_06433 [Pyricularia sp. CBS 133598]|nr:hypothetical protein PspLS_06433 [Pyricularia sp. CBS 133598]
MELISLFRLLQGASWISIFSYGIGISVGLWIFSVLLQLLNDPLAGIPGPIYCRFSRLPYVYWVCTGRLVFRIKELHDQYGEVFRIAPDEVQFINPDAWKDIFGHKTQGAKEFPKDLRFYPMPPGGVRDLLTADHANHPRMRRMLSPAFAEKTLREQETIITSYVDFMVGKLRGMITKQDDGAVYAQADMVKWYNYLIFDIVGDLTFGKPFFCLASSDYHPWVSTIFSSTKGAIIANNGDYLPAVKYLAMLLLVISKPRLVIDRINRLKYSVNRTSERLASKADRPDFMSYIMKGAETGQALSKEELDANADLLVFAGSETTSTFLSGCTYFVLSNPNVYKRLVAEIRGSFNSEEEMTFASIQRLPYLSAVMQEAFRMYPPIPVGPPRKVPEGGAIVRGISLPENTAVAITQYAAGHSETNFTDPYTFTPERWLPDADERFASDRRRAVQPFAVGPRNCIGQNLATTEIRLTMIKMLWHFEMELAPECANWNKQSIFGLWEKPPLMVKLRPHIMAAPMSVFTLQNLFMLPVVALAITLIYYGLVCIYNLYFHPLAKYPGPRLAAATHFWLMRAYLSGKAYTHIHEAHKKYGPVVRTTPNGLSYVNAKQWKEIYGHQPSGHPEFSKQAFASAVFEEPTLHNADREYHGYVRRLFAHGFSEKALKGQESVLKEYVDWMFAGIERESQGGSSPVNVVNWYNYLTFDFIGFLTYGESFDCLRTSSLHDWIKLFISFGKLLIYGQVLLPIPRLLKIPVALLLIPSKLREDRKRASALQSEKIKHRLSIQPTITDFTTKMVEAYNNGKMSMNQFEGNSILLIGAGSETTATALSGLTWLLSQNPKVLKKLTTEVRSAFTSTDQITSTGVNSCKYLLACVEEALRVYPPLAQPHYRIVPRGGATVNGEYLPEDMVVSVPKYAVARSHLNFHRPDDFVPERWLGDGERGEFANDQRDASQPFSVGPRACIARNLAYLEIKLIIARLVWQYDIENATEGDWLGSQNLWHLWEKGPLWLRLKAVAR